MKNNHLYIQLMVMLFGMFTLVQGASAHKLEDKDSPISFQLEMLPWEKVDNIIPNKTKFTIIDVETGKQFKVQRRAGSKHADVQPLTSKDTKIMKEIYKGKWSWKRRAALVLINDQLIAGSMHGMPHGAGALQNGFPGHFCIHFSGSTTHRSKNPDFSHELMILKAAGKLDEYMNGASPYEVIEVFAESINQEDAVLFQLATSDDYKKRLKTAVKGIEHITLEDIPAISAEDRADLIVMEVPLKVEIYKENIGKEKKTIRFVVRKDGIISRWLIDSQSLYQQLK